MPYIERAMREGYEVVVLNTNLNRWPDGSKHQAEATLIPVCASVDVSLTYSCFLTILQP